jgi:hypothetical protein
MYIDKTKFIPFEELTKVSIKDGNLLRHIESLWAEIKSLKEEVEILKNNSRKNHVI